MGCCASKGAAGAAAGQSGEQEKKAKASTVDVTLMKTPMEAQRMEADDKTALFSRMEGTWRAKKISSQVFSL